MAKSKFEAQVTAWVRKTELRLEAVFRFSAQAVANEVRVPVGKGGNMPVLTGNLRRSLVASKVEMPTVEPGKEFPDKTENIKLVIAGAQIGETVFLGFQAAYARRMEYGFQGEDSAGRTFNQKGRGFVRLTAQRWPKIVREQARLLKSRVEARQAPEK